MKTSALRGGAARRTLIAMLSAAAALAMAAGTARAAGTIDDPIPDDAIQHLENIDSLQSYPISLSPYVFTYGSKPKGRLALRKWKAQRAAQIKERNQQAADAAADLSVLVTRAGEDAERNHERRDKAIESAYSALNDELARKAENDAYQLSLNQVSAVRAADDTLSDGLTSAQGNYIDTVNPAKNAYQNGVSKAKLAQRSALAACQKADERQRAKILKDWKKANPHPKKGAKPDYSAADKALKACKDAANLAFSSTVSGASSADALAAAKDKLAKARKACDTKANNNLAQSAAVEAKRLACRAKAAREYYAVANRGGLAGAYAKVRGDAAKDLNSLKGQLTQDHERALEDIDAQFSAPNFDNDIAQEALDRWKDTAVDQSQDQYDTEVRMIQDASTAAVRALRDNYGIAVDLNAS